MDYEQPACSAAEVLERACALAGLVTVYTLERDYPETSPPERAELLKAYVYLSRVYRSRPPTGLQLSPSERAILERPLGSWPEADKLNVGWRTECAAVLGWAVGVIDALAPYDEMVPYDWIQPLTRLGTREQHVTLRAAAELDAALTEAETWHWRARQVRGYFPDASVDALTGEDAFRRTQMIRRALRDRVVLFGKPYEMLTFAQWSLASSIASERHYALKWSWDGEPWDEVRTDT